MIFQKSMKKSLADRGYRHCQRDEELTRHGDYARNMQFAFSKEHLGNNEKVVDIIFLSTDLRDEKFVIGFFRENLSIQNGVLENSTAKIPLLKFSLDEFEKQLDRLIPRGSPLRGRRELKEKF